MPQKCLFQGFPPSQALSQALFFLLFSPKGMLTHSRENIWRLIVAWEQSEGKMGRGSPQLEGLKILAIKKKNQKNPNQNYLVLWISSSSYCYCWLVGFYRKIKPQMLFSPLLKKPGSHFMPSSWEPHHPHIPRGDGKGSGGVSLGRTRFSGMLVAGGKPDALNIPR